MSIDQRHLDFDATGEEKSRRFVQQFFESSRSATLYKREEFQRIYELYKNVMEMTGRDARRSNLFIPKLYSNVETIVPLYHDALLGQRPYINIELSNNRSAEMGEAITQLLDEYLHEADFFYQTVKWIKYVLLYGTGFLEATPDFVTKKVKEAVPQFITDFNGNRIQVGRQLTDVEKTFFKLNIKAYAPWDIYPDWAYGADTIEGCRGIVKFRGMVSKRQVKEMAKRGAFGDNFDVDGIDGNLEQLNEDDWAKRIATNIGVNLPHEDDDLGAWLSFESKDRYIDMWGFTTMLRDVDNPYNHGKINLTRTINTDDPNYFNAWFGIGEGRPVEQLCYALNDNWNQAFDNHNLMQQKVMLYDEEAVDVDQLAMIPGNRIPVTPGLNATAGDAVAELPVQPMTSDFYSIPGVMEGMIDGAMGVHDPLRGESSGGKTARESILLNRAGTSRMKVKIRMGEQMGLKDFGEKAISIIDQFAGPDDIISKIGVEKASTLPAVNPEAFGERFNFVFKGSGRLADDLVQRQNALDLYQMMAERQTIDPVWLDDWVLEKFDVPNEERQKAIVDPKMQMLQQLLAQQQEQGGAESQRAITDGRTIGGSGGNTPSGRSNTQNLTQGIV